jgi:hypothetical protein
VLSPLENFHYTMDSCEFGGTFGFNEEEPLQSPPATVQRRKGRLPWSPIAPTAPEPTTETPNYTDEDTYDHEPHTPTTSRKQQPQSQPPRASAPSLMDTLIAQNMQAIESNKQTMESNKQMMQAFMHTMEHLAPPDNPHLHLHLRNRLRIPTMIQSNKSKN